MRVVTGLIGGRLVPAQAGIDVVVGVHVGLVGRAHVGAAAGAGLRVDVAHMVRGGAQLARDTGPAFAALALPVGTIGLLALGRRQGRIVGRLGRNGELGLERGHARLQRGDLFGLSQYQRYQRRLVELGERISIHAALGAARANPFNPPTPSQTVAPEGE